MREFAPVGGETAASGILTSPQHKGVPLGIVQGKRWIADVGCLDGPDFVKRVDLNAIAEWLPKMEAFKNRCLGIAGGDIVGNSEATLEAFEEFKGYFSGWPLLYVAQNGAENLPIPDDCVGVFIGGIPIPGRILRSGRLMDWKDSPEAVQFIKRAQAMDKHIHIGRINWYRRFKIFTILEGYESFTFDGTRTRFDGTKKTVAAWQSYRQQSPLFTI